MINLKSSEGLPVLWGRRFNQYRLHLLGGTMVAFLWSVSIGSLFGQTSTALPPATAARIDFTTQILPLLRERCYSCHAGSQLMGGLRLDSRAAALAGGYSGAVIKPGKSANSKLIHLVAGTLKGSIMPMAGQRFTPEQVGLFRAWIDQGLDWPENATVASVDAASPVRHWAFTIPRRPTPPHCRRPEWARNSIDHFILTRLEKDGIQPSAEADRYTLVRRVTLDLIGLPPSPEEIQAFVNDKGRDSYERVVDRLLMSPSYGERWARQWLDLARYADSDGYEKDSLRPDAWKWRDWVINALNRGVPFDQFTIEQIAGDLLPAATIPQKLATGFHRNTLTNREGGVDREEFRVEQVVDRTSTVGTVWLGLTLACARCHDHKYDPITQKEFYEFSAFFNSADEADIKAPLPGELASYLQRQEECHTRRTVLLAEYKVADLQPVWERKMLEAAAHPGVDLLYDASWDIFGIYVDRGQEYLRLPLGLRSARWNRKITDFFIANYFRVANKEQIDKIKFKDLNEKLNQLKTACPELSEAQVLAERAQIRPTHILLRGDFRQPGIEVEPGIPASLNAPLTGPKLSRLDLAKWLVSRDNPLTARVTVNRAWQELFGRGLVSTSDDFGTRADPPSHPELLDWLAVEFMENGWNLKDLHRLIVTSATYRQSSNARDDLLTLDPENRFFARQRRLRLSAEAIRDVALAASGLLNREVGGPCARPPMPPGILDLGYGAASRWSESTGRERYRRGIYTLFLRTTPHPQLVNFDAPDSMSSCSRRERSTTPLQALNLLNDSTFFEAAQLLATRILREGGTSITDRMRYAFLLCLAREPRPPEMDRLIRFYHQQREILGSDPAQTHALFPATDIDDISESEAAPWVSVGRLLLNLEELITRG